MYLFIISLVLFVPILGLLIYKQNGKREIFRFDFVQFIYLFLFMPAIFIASKAVLFYLLTSDITLKLTAKQNFIIDATFSLVLFYLFSFVSIHSLTKTFWLRKNDDPEFDIFHLSEYFHLWWSHIAMNLGGMIGLTFLSTLNVLIPIYIVNNRNQLLFTLLIAVISGISVFFIIWSEDPKQQKRRFLRVMKSFLLFFSMYHIILYFLVEPKFTMSYVLFWFIFVTYISATVSGFSFVRSEKIRKLQRKMTHKGWGENIEIHS